MLKGAPTIENWTINGVTNGGAAAKSGKNNHFLYSRIQFKDMFRLSKRVAEKSLFVQRIPTKISTSSYSEHFYFLCGKSYEQTPSLHTLQHRRTCLSLKMYLPRKDGRQMYLDPLQTLYRVMKAKKVYVHNVDTKINSTR